MPPRLAYVRYREQSGLDMLAMSLSGFDPTRTFEDTACSGILAEEGSSNSNIRKMILVLSCTAQPGRREALLGAAALTVGAAFLFGPSTKRNSQYRRYQSDIGTIQKGSYGGLS